MPILPPSWFNKKKETETGLKASVVLDQNGVKVIEANLNGDLLWFAHGVPDRSLTEGELGGGVGPGGIQARGAISSEKEYQWKFFYDKEKMKRFATDEQIGQYLTMNASAVSGTLMTTSSFEPLSKEQFRVALPSGPTKSKTQPLLVEIERYSEPHTPLRITQNPRGHEILTDDRKRLNLVHTSEDLKKTSLDLNSILPETSNEAPTGLWVDLTVNSHMDDLRRLAQRLERSLYVDSLGTINPN